VPLSRPVKRNTTVFAIVYGTWCLLWVVPAVLNSGELRIGAHLVLAITGMPLALSTLYMQNASVLAIITAAVLGLAQWSALVAWWSTDEPGAKE
jgi:hypothetical protein